ncbi:hypothetical protein EPI10_005426 [Gossypium australe]|uniref:Uncharacterized protein n=1 Tax=Gossypium australe TaxID=47621 RepID=A0A5B6WQD8_9ROSI|nr:hypothetical protein EPI10_005426 [Gossypium australe]
MGPIDPPIPRKMPGRPKRCRVKEGTSAPISNGPTLITDNLVPTSGTSNQDNEIFYQLRSRDVVNLDTRAPTITTPPSQPIVEG